MKQLMDSAKRYSISYKKYIVAKDLTFEEVLLFLLGAWFGSVVYNGKFPDLELIEQPESEEKE